MYIRFIQNLDEKSYISAKIEAVKQLHAVCFVNCGTVPTPNQIVEIHGLFYVIDVAWLDVVIGM